MGEILQTGSSIGWGFADLVDVTQDRDKWWARVNTVMNLQVPKYAGNFFVK
jgi:hypothetical protein